jgi:putative aldouronate transport system substrate-binding protein
MKTNNRKPMKPWAVTLCTAMAVTIFAGCSTTPKPGATADEGKKTEAPYKLSIMIPSFQTDAATAESKIWKQIEERTNTKLDILWTPDASYKDKLNITLASGTIPAIIETDSVKVPSIANAIKAGAFWEVGPYLKNYPNLSKANPTILNNTSSDGKNYALYRSRPIGRMGISYRKDWLANVGLQEPKTIDDFYNMLKAFTNNDPDKNGKNDTYGMVVTKYSGPWDIMQTWFGVPNKWGEDKDGKLVPAHLTPEYMDALKFFKKLYDEKLINSDFAVYDSAKWNDPIINGKAGVAVDVVGRSYQIEDALQKVDPKGAMDVIGAVSGPKGLHNLPTTGYAGVLLISKSVVKTEDDLKKVLNFLDKINDKDMQLLINNGIEGVHYKIEDGKLVTLIRAEEAQSADINGKSLNQMLMFVPGYLDGLFKPGTPLRGKADTVQAANEKIIVPNPAEPLSSATYTQKGAQLDTIVDDARIKFIVGKVDEAGYNADMDLWRKTGGDQYIKEINEAYAIIKKK